MEEKICLLIEENSEIFEEVFSHPQINYRAIADAEEKLGVELPRAYYWFLQKYGSGGFGFSIFGFDGNGKAFFVDETKKERENGLPPNLIVVQSHGKFVDCIDVETEKIVSWSAHDKLSMTEKYPNFYSYFLAEIENSIKDLQS